MRRPSILAALVLLLACGAISIAGYRLAGKLPQLAGNSDDLEWLRAEFHLGDAEMGRIRKLHEGYLPLCQGYCAQVAAKRMELGKVLGSGTNNTQATEQILQDISTLRARCQAEMLRHFAEISQVMPAGSGQRYLAEMQRLTLGVQEPMEHHMHGQKPSSHGQH